MPLNKDLVLLSALDVLNQICRCGHFESEHFLNKKLDPVKCAECGCRKYKTVDFSWLIKELKEKYNVTA